MFHVRNSCSYYVKLDLRILIICCWTLMLNINAHTIDERSFQYLNSIPSEDWKRDLDFGIESVNRQKRLEENLVKSGVIVEDGGISHHNLLDALPNEEAKMDNDVARKLLATSLYVFNNKCLPHGIDGQSCETFLSNKTLPKGSDLLQECLRIIENRRNGHNAFRRLLDRHYQDGIYQMLPLVSPLWVSKSLHNLSVKKDLEDKQRNLAVVQWTQFIEHDLSQPVVTTMRDGSHIECCDSNSFELLPRYRHPFCAPLTIKSDESQYAKVNCLNYVRSAVAASTKCTFGAVEQLNQATSLLDLSQLYGFTDEAQKRMRTWNNGQIKSTASVTPSEMYTDGLAVITGDWSNYCAFKNPSRVTSQCFMAGDSRVNKSPLTISIYTLFMRNHNQIAKKLTIKYPSWQDENLFRTAKAINIQIYRNIVFDEWVPNVLGEDVAGKIKEVSPNKGSVTVDRISNEFGIAAMRFYMSMMPNYLQNFTEVKRVEYTTSGSPPQESSSVIRNENVVSLLDQTYKPDLEYTHEQIDTILDSILNQHAMKLDTIYEESLIWNKFGVNRPTHGDLLAFDIQRGRDHGLRGYIDYLKLSIGKNIGSWKDLERFIEIDDLNVLKGTYSNVENIDLLVGGMAEKNSLGAIVGPTFKYILAEQFSKIYQRQLPDIDAIETDLVQFRKVNAVELLCANSKLKNVPGNIFRLSSEKNPMLSCNEHVELLRP
ncbi:salivary peroxidase/catechol oxidase isoform X1 [Bactrocera oleae]|uniref:salivary peroxidase/catechol oxidase isoform X1 n=1 Tax=Bactrocera oleae TaxID=104688 RepID=UPI00387ECA55